MKVPMVQGSQGAGSTPTVRTPIVPGAVPGAFGAGMGQAAAGMGEAAGRLGEVIGKRIEQRRMWDQTQQGSDALEAYRTNLQNYILGDETVNVANGDGTTRELPSLLKRQGTNADGATVEYDQKASELARRLKEQFSAYDPRISQHLNNEMDNMTAGFRNRVISHEATEWRRGKQASFEAAVTNEINQAMLADTPEALDKSMQAISAKSAILSTFLGEDGEMAKKRMGGYLAEGALQAAQASLRATNDIAMAQKLLDGIKDNPSVTSEIFETAKTELEQFNLKLQQAVRKETLLNQYRREDELTEAFVRNELGVNSVMAEMNAGTIRPKFANAIIKNLNARKPKRVTEFDEYESIMADIVNPDVNATDIRARILALNSAGKLSDNDRDSLLFTTKLGQDPIFLKYLDENKAPNPLWEFLAHPWTFIKERLGNSVESASIMSKTIARTKTGQVKPEDLNRIATEEVDRHIRATNPQRTAYEVNQIITNDASGKSYKVVGFYPDGEPEVDEIE